MKMRVENMDLNIEFSKEKSVLEIFHKNDIQIDQSCGGMGSCGTCRVFVNSDVRDLPPRNEIEQERATDLGFAPNERLSCQLCPHDGLIVEIP